MSESNTSEVVVLDEEKRSYLQAIIIPSSEVVRGLEVPSKGDDANYIIYLRDKRGSEQRIYLVNGPSRQMFKWSLVAPELNQARKKEFAYFAFMWNMQVEELHELILKHRPW